LDRVPSKVIARLHDLWRLVGGDADAWPMASRLQQVESLLASLISDVASCRGQTQVLGDGLKAELEELKSLLGSMRAELEELKSLLGSMRAELEEPKSLLASVRGDADRLAAHVVATRNDLVRLGLELDAARSKADVDGQLFESLEEYRASEPYRLVYERKAPLVSVCISTYNRARLLVERCLASVVAQDYPNLEIVVVGDGCSDETEEAVAQVGDPRIRFENLPQRELYPEDPEARWMVAGTASGNRALTLARGDLITHLDDDDEFTPDRISKLVAFLRETRAELVWHPFWWEVVSGQWVICPAEDFRLAQVTTGSVLYLSWFKRLPWDPKAYRYREPGDWNRYRKIKYLEARLRRYPEPLLRHYLEFNQKPRAAASPPRSHIDGRKGIP
jgi:hypothetical protein